MNYLLEVRPVLPVVIPTRPCVVCLMFDDIIISILSMWLLESTHSFTICYSSIFTLMYPCNSMQDNIIPADVGWSMSYVWICASVGSINYVSHHYPMAAPAVCANHHHAITPPHSAMLAHPPCHHFCHHFVTPFATTLPQNLRHLMNTDSEPSLAWAQTYPQWLFGHAGLLYLAGNQSTTMCRLYRWCTLIFLHTRNQNQCAAKYPHGRIFKCKQALTGADGPVCGFLLGIVCVPLSLWAPRTLS